MRIDGAAGRAAEEMAHGGTDRETPATIAALRRHVGDLVAGQWWQRAGGPPVTVLAARSSAQSSSARTGEGVIEIRLAAGQHDLATIIHELAHALAGLDHDHGAEFRRANVDIAAALGGAAARDALESSYALFELEVAERRWPAPHGAVGEGFVVLPTPEGDPG